MKCIIVDDEAMARRSLARLCEKIEDLEVVATCASGLDAMKVLRREAVDLLLLDVEMPDLTGLDMVKQDGPMPQVIFITSKKEYAFEAFEYNATDYVAKPVSLSRLVKAVNRARMRKKFMVPSKRDSEEIYIKVDGRLVRVNYQDILYVETYGDYVNVATYTKTYVVHSTLKAIGQKLEDPRFLKVHRSFIVNLNKIVDIEDTTLVISDKVIPISRANKPLLMSRINRL